MIIQENTTNYRLVIYPEDVKYYSLEELIENLKEASGLCGKPLGKYTYIHYPAERMWVVFIDKEN